MLNNFEVWAIQGLNSSITTHLTIALMAKNVNISQINILLFDFITINTL